MARPDSWTNDPEGRKKMYSDLKGIKTKQGTSYTSYMKSAGRHDRKAEALKRANSKIRK